MPDWLSIAVTFPNERYHGLEWPPSPARLFQALLAGAMTGRYREQWENARPILQWLERQPAPVIVTAAAHDAKAYRLAVPNNDLDIAAREWKKGKPYDAALLRTLKTVRPHEMEAGGRVPHVRYLWEVAGAETTKDWVLRLRALSDCLHTLGWGIDMAYADTALLQEREVRQLAGERWLPGGGEGYARKVPVEGSLEDLRAVYERFKNRISPTGVDPDTRPTVYGVQAYRREGHGVRPWAGFSLLKRDGGAKLARDGRDVMVVAAWLRHACAAAMAEEGESQDWINRYVHGHDPDGVRGHRMSFVPLPTIGHAHTDGRIRRALVTEPAESPGKAVALLGIKLAGETITGDGGKGGCQLTRREGTDGVWDFYLRRAHVWRSVTPMVLHGHNCLRGKLSIHKTERLLLEALENSGYPERVVESVIFQPAPLWRGTQAAREIRVPKHLERWPRYHVEVRFREPVRGPVLAGIGRHCGIGVFAAD